MDDMDMQENESLPNPREGTPCPGEESPHAVKEPRPSRKDLPRPGEGFLRPENEDDDGYDPYSDRREVRSMWEEDPWR